MKFNHSCINSPKLVSTPLTCNKSMHQKNIFHLFIYINIHTRTAIIFFKEDTFTAKET